MKSGFLRQCITLRRTKRTPYVKAYLEGVPKPQKVIDRIAGADLSSSNGVDFFTTAPRYIDVKREQRISSLFFHHILYPAGGARAPYQPIIVRGGRGVRKKAYPIATQKKQCVHSSGDAEKKEVDPLRAPDVVGQEINRPYLDVHDFPEASWASSDPARRTYFFSPRDPQSSLFHPYEGRVSMRWNKESVRSVSISPPRWRSYTNPCHTVRSGSASESVLEDRGRAGSLSAKGMSSFSHSLSRSSDAYPEKRNSVEDSALALLAGSLEAHLNSSDEGKNDDHSSLRTDEVGRPLRNPCLQRIEKLLVKNSCGLLCFSKDGSGKPVETCAVEGIKSGEEILAQILNDSLSGSEVTPLYRYLPLELPEEAVVKISVPRRTSAKAGDTATIEDGTLQVCRLMGGVEPFVPFAVGSPLSRPLQGDSNLSHTLFAHINILARISFESPEIFTHSSTMKQPPQQDRRTSVHQLGSSPSPKFTGVHEGILGTQLDPLIPLKHRTFIERGSSTTDELKRGESHIVIGRDDAEMYFVPHRPLRLTVFVPSFAENRCAEQNQLRIRKQVQLGHQRGNDQTVWPTSGRMTSDKKILHQHNVINIGKDCGVRSGSNHLTYNIQAIPGDAIYIPRGWGLSVQRILGSSVALGEGERFFPSTSVRSGEGSSGPKVDVDGFFILYKPYPVLTPAQSSVYVSANYVHGGITEFYEKGGNSVYHRYE